MDHFEQLVNEALAEGAEDAPTAAGLAAGASRRARARRRRRIGVEAIVVAALVALAIVVPARMLPHGSRQAAPAAAAWRTHTVWGASIDLPGECAFVASSTSGTGGSGGSGCGVQAVRGYKGELPLDPGLRRDHGTWSAAVDQTGVVFLIGGVDRATILRIVGSIRPAGVGVPDLSLGWITVHVGGYAVDVPRALGAGAVSAHTPRPVSMIAPLKLRGRAPATLRTPGRWVASFEIRGSTTIVDLVAPTRVLADLIATTARRDAGPWQRHQVDGVTFETPPTWIPVIGCPGRYAPPPTGAEASRLCGDADSVVVGHGILDTALDSTAARVGGGQWAGYVQTSAVDGRYVVVSTDDRATTQRILDSVGPVAAATPTRTATAWHTVERAGAWLDLPAGCSLAAVTPATCDGLVRVDAKVVGPLDDLVAPGLRRGPSSATGLVTTHLPRSDVDVTATGHRGDVVRRVLASLRPAGVAAPARLGGPWLIDALTRGVGVEVPTSQPARYGATLVPRDAPLSLPTLVRGVWRSVVAPRGHDVRVLVREPTQALAELVAASAGDPVPTTVLH